MGTNEKIRNARRTGEREKREQRSSDVCNLVKHIVAVEHYSVLYYIPVFSTGGNGIGIPMEYANVSFGKKHM